MPHHPSDEDTSSHVFDQVAKESKDSTASDHPIHRESEGAARAAAEDHKSKGPQIPDKMPEAAGKDELKAKAQQLNK